MAIAVSLLSVRWTLPRASAAIVDAARQDLLERFVASRRDLALACLYTFDRLGISSNTSASASLHFESTGEDIAADVSTASRLSATYRPTIREHIGRDCPFGNLQFDPDLVTSLEDGNSSRQLGAHLAEDPRNDILRPQIASNDVVGAKEFYSAAMTNGFSVEFSYRRRVETNQTMTLFSIGNRFGGCTDPGFRVDLISTHVVMLIYFFPVVEGTDLACYEMRLFSARVGSCVMPHYRSNIDDNPVVHVIISVQGAKHTKFFVKYMDPVTMEAYECAGSDTAKLPDATHSFDYIQGSYRLFIGNNPRNVSLPLKRAKIASIRQYRDPNWDDRPAEDRLRDMIKQKLDSIEGPRIPTAFRIFGGKSISFSVLGVQLPPVNEDTPLKWARNKLADFKKDHGDELVNFIVESLKKGNKTSDSGVKTYESSGSGSGGGENYKSRGEAFQGIYPNANASTFDIFHFGFYRKPISTETARITIWPTWMTPHRPFMELKKTVHIKENKKVLLDLLQLHSVYDDVRLQVDELPRAGKLLLYPNETVLTVANLRHFQDLPKKEQQRIFFVPGNGDNNKNIKSDQFGRQFDPYAVFRYRIWKSELGRTVNSSQEAVIEIFVDSIDKLPSLGGQFADVQADDRKPVYLNLSSGDSVGVSQNSTSQARLRQLGLFDGLDLISTDPVNKSFGPSRPHESVNIRILELPRYGRLYDRQMSNLTESLNAANAFDLNQVEVYRIRQKSIVNQTFSPSLVYVYEAVGAKSKCPDLLKYQLRYGSSSAYSSPSSVVFHLQSPSVVTQDSGVNPVAVLLVDEDSSTTVTLADFELQMGPSTRFRVDILPEHGRLYQFLSSPPTHDNPKISYGSPIESSGADVIDMRGRLVYVPDPNYYNSILDGVAAEKDQVDGPLDWFAFTAVGQDNRSAHTGSLNYGSKFDGQTLRSIQLQVVNIPDDLVLLPPTVFTTNATRGDAVEVPVVFSDPDEFLGSYRITLTATDKSSVIEIGHAITNEDILKFCALQRPCHLVRSANKSFSSDGRGDVGEDRDWQLQFRVDTQAWNPSHIDVQGGKTALQYALRQLIFRDMSLWTWYSGHTAKLEVTVERVNAKLSARTKMSYYVDYLPSNATQADSLGQALSNLARLVSMGLWLAGFCLVLSSASCCTMGFCCCCARARAKKRREFENKRRRYVAQVVQNDFEYSSLLMTLKDVLTGGRLDTSAMIIDCCSDDTTNARTILQALCLRNIVPLLTCQGRGLHFVVHVLRIELDDSKSCKSHLMFAYPSLGGAVMAQYFKTTAAKWLINLQRSLSRVEFGGDGTLRLLSTLEEHIVSLPEEVHAAICTISSIISSSNVDVGIAPAAHMVFFNHLVGPSLWFADSSSRSTSSQERRFREDIAAFARYDKVSRSFSSSSLLVPDTRTRYELLLHKIAAPPPVPPHETNSAKDVDCELVASCLTNLHSILDHILPNLKKKEEISEADQIRLDKDVDDEVCGEVEVSPIAKIQRILRALNFPLASCDSLLSYSASELLRDPVFWSGFSSNEWWVRSQAAAPIETEEEASTTRTSKQLYHSASLLSVDVAQFEESSATSFESARSSGEDRVEFHF